MRLVFTAVTWAGRTAVSLIGGLILLVASISLVVGVVNGSPTKGLEAGAKAGFAIVHYTTVAAGIVSSYGDDVGPGFSSGQELGDRQSVPAKA
jgi:hypothetical protein